MAIGVLEAIYKLTFFFTGKKRDSYLPVFELEFRNCF